MKLILLCTSALLLSSLSWAKSIDLSKDFDSLGGNKALLKRARTLDPKNRVRIVQKRTVDRNLRFEFGVNYGAVASGNTYMNTENFGGNIDFHINPRWSVGVRHYQSYNTLTNEGENVFENSVAMRREYNTSDYNIPAIDYPIQTTLATLSWYPIYGKMNIFNKAVTHFDFYTLIGGGTVKLNSGPTGTFTAGAGLGIWFSQHVSSRLELRYQTYQDQPSTEARDLNLMVATASIGLLL